MSPYEWSLLFVQQNSCVLRLLLCIYESDRLMDIRDR